MSFRGLECVCADAISTTATACEVTTSGSVQQDIHYPLTETKFDASFSFAPLFRLIIHRLQCCNTRLFTPSRTILLITRLGIVGNAPQNIYFIVQVTKRLELGSFSKVVVVLEKICL